MIWIVKNQFCLVHLIMTKGTFCQTRKHQFAVFVTKFKSLKDAQRSKDPESKKFALPEKTHVCRAAELHNLFAQLAAHLNKRIFLAKPFRFQIDLRGLR